MRLRKLQIEATEWQIENFGTDVEPWRSFIGIVEEIGEMAHALLKMRDGTRADEDHMANLRDGAGDLIIFLATFASRMGFDLEDVVAETWAKVKLRDWRKYPVDGVSK